MVFKIFKISTVPSAIPSGSSASATSVVPPVSFSSHGVIARDLADCPFHTHSSASFCVI